MDNIDFKVGAQNGTSVSVILDFTKLSYGDLYYFMALLKGDMYCTIIERNALLLQLPVGEVLLTFTERKECNPIRIFYKIIL